MSKIILLDLHKEINNSTEYQTIDGVHLVETLRETIFQIKISHECTQINFPVFNTDKHSLYELRHIYFKKYGPYSLEVYKKIAKKFFEKFLKSYNNKQKSFINQMYILNKIYMLSCKSFNLIYATSLKLLFEIYISIVRLSDQIKNPEFTNLILYPHQDKMNKAKKSALFAIGKFNKKMIKFFHEHPSLIFKLPTNFLKTFLQNNNTIKFSTIGGYISRMHWLDTSIADIITPLHDTYWNNYWKRKVSAFFPDMPRDICILISQFITFKVVGQSFANYFDKIYDKKNENIRSKYASMVNLVERRTISMVGNIKDTFIIKINQIS